MYTQYIQYPPVGQIVEYPSATNFPPTNYNGALVLALDTDTLYVYNTGSNTYVPIASPAAELGITALVGDGTATGPGVATLTLASVNSNVGSFTNANITVNAKGLITAAANGTSNPGTVTSVAASTNTVSGLTVTGSPITSSGTLAFSLAQATTSTNGYLSSVDWNTFSSKQPVGNYITALTGDITATGPGSATATLATVNTSPGTFTNATLTVNAKGLITAASNGTTAVTAVTATSPITSSGGTTPNIALTTVPISLGGTSQTTAPAARGPNGLNIDERTTVNNANYSAVSTDRYIAQIGTLTGSITITLPAASSVNAGQELYVGDESGTASTTDVITVAGNGTDTINGSASKTIRSAYGFMLLKSNGSNGWFTGVEAIGRGGTGLSTLPTNGQLLIGNTTNSNYTLSTLTASNGISITNGAGSISIEANTFNTTVALAGNYTIAATDEGTVFFLNSAGGSFTVTLPAASTMRNGFSFWLKDYSGSYAQTNPVTLARNGSDFIEGLGSNYSLQTPYGRWLVVTDTVGWYFL